MLSIELFQKIKKIEIHTRQMVNDSFAGEYLSVFKGRGMEFDEVRPYLPGDDTRTIDWNVTARTGTPYVKRYVEERELTVMLAVDASASENFGSINRFKRELAAELTAVLSFAATNNNDKVGLMVFTDKIELLIPPRKGRKHVLRMIRELLAFQPQGTGTDLQLALDTLNRLLKRRSIVFLVSDFIGNPDDYRHTLAITNRRHDLIAMDLSDPLEMEIPNVGLLALEDSESGEITWVETSQSSWRQEFQSRTTQRDAAKEQMFLNSQVDRVPITTAEDYADALAHFFKARARRFRR